ncbi:MAG: multicopper oxidase family protein [Microthrixaceae bacterium]
MTRRKDLAPAVELRRAARRHRNIVIGASLVATGAIISTALAVPALADLANGAQMHRMASAALPTQPVDCNATNGPTAAHASFTQPLVVPPKIDRRSSTSAVNLIMRAGMHRFSPDLPLTPTYGYALNRSQTDIYLGPTIEAKKGVPVRLNVTNSLGQHPLANFVDTQVMGTEVTDAAAPRGAVHLHGAHSEAAQDGLPTDTFGPGQAHSYKYGNDQDATTLWYHDHSWGVTRLQVTAGLAGQYWLRDQYDTGSADNPLRLPTGNYEMPLTLQDRAFNADGSLAYPIGPHCGMSGLPADYPNQWSPESFGDVATVNGVVEPNLTVDKGVYRFHMLNGSNARFYDLQLRRIGTDGLPTADFLPLQVIGSDGGLLNTPASMGHVLIAPGERYDVLIDFSALTTGARYRFENSALAPYPDGGDYEIHEIMQFTVGKKLGTTRKVPATLRGGKNQPALVPVASATSLGAAPVANTRTVFLNEIVNSEVDPGPADEPVHVMMGNQFYADDITMQPRSQQVENPAVNSVEVWEIVNTTGDAHPVHLHLTQFRVLNRQDVATDPVTGETTYLGELGNGLPFPNAAGTGPWPAPSASPYVVGDPRGPEADEVGWKDVVIAYPNTVTRIVVPFGGRAAGIPAPYDGDKKGAAVQRFTGNYVFHCHILEHEDNDMMSPLRVG